MTPLVTIVDYGVGNLRSVARALAACGAAAKLSTSPAEIAAADRVVLPGVGAFANCVAAMQACGFVDAVRSFVAAGRPLLGICVGMQMLLDTSEEFGTHAGLGFVAGRVLAVPRTGADGLAHKIPHIGWSDLHPARNDWDGTIMAGIAPQTPCYFLHSFAAVPDRAVDRLAGCRYDGIDICAAIAKDNVSGVQFHPEKSGPAGLKILENFVFRT